MVGWLKISKAQLSHHILQLKELPLEFFIEKAIDYWVDHWEIIVIGVLLRKDYITWTDHGRAMAESESQVKPFRFQETQERP